MKKNILLVGICLVLSTGLYFGLNYYKSPKIGYVKSQVILRDYKEMINASKQFDEELKVVQGNLDTLKSRYDRLRVQEPTIPATQQKDWMYRVSVAQEEFEKYNMQVSEQMQERREELTEKVLVTINESIQQYGKENGYQFIFGATTDGSILYGREGDDLTQAILTTLNQSAQPPLSSK
jgi:outer membrane protein